MFRPAKTRLLKFCLPFLVLFAASSTYGQQTVFDVPSADVLDKGKAYFELDGTARPVDSLSTFTPRVVVGIGHQVEVGVNFNGLIAPTIGQMEISPTIKWRIWDQQASGWLLYIGDDLFFPVRDRTFNAGNYFYACFAKEWEHGTRIGFGGYDFTRNVVATANRAGGQFTLEQRVSSRLTLAAEWYTGNQAAGYVNPGAIVKLFPKLTLYAAYQIGNAGVTTGNHDANVSGRVLALSWLIEAVRACPKRSCLRKEPSRPAPLIEMSPRRGSSRKISENAPRFLRAPPKQGDFTQMYLYVKWNRSGLPAAFFALLPSC